MEDEYPPVELTLIPTGSFSVARSLQKLDTILTRFWTKLEARAAASPPQQESTEQQVDSCKSRRSPQSIEGKQAPDLTPIHSLKPGVTQGSAPPRPEHQ
ncbi:Hypothetical predicted protein [Pelobates cultripes]|uniref:Uncharacterized protein n=1 Tax=Pelobates cultripes TaxID=61616 RepID=A0AAD1WYL3_PELCU|nr:Hypothetical predicted protein [Pelobates cultripes]